MLEGKNTLSNVRLKTTNATTTDDYGNKTHQVLVSHHPLL